MAQPVHKYSNPEDQQQQQQIKTTTTTTMTTTTTTTTPEPTNNYKCWAEFIGDYLCCESGQAVEFKDEDGEWGYDKQKHEWCGITKYKDVSGKEPCWSEDFGISCCKGCKIYSEDEDGQWGYEDGQWCGIPSYCPMNN